jgi:ubiquitin-conjugating enzyme E2 Q
MEDPLPVGMGLRVPPPDPNKMAPTPQVYPIVGMRGMSGLQQAPPPPAPPVQHKVFTVGQDGLGDFDDLSLQEVCPQAVGLLFTLITSADEGLDL